MTNEALAMIISVWSIVICTTGYFFYLVLKTPPKNEPDSFTDEDSN